MEIGRVVRVQVQERPLKQGPRGARAYRPEAIRPVAEAELTPAGVCGLTDHGPLLDVHHADHAQSRNRQGSNGLSICFTSHYHWLRQQFGAHLVDGVAGENLLVATDATFMAADLPVLLQLHTADGVLELVDVAVAEPCVEFTRFCLQRDPAAATDERLQTALESLRRGVRGYYARFSGRRALLAPGDRLCLPD